MSLSLFDHLVQLSNVQDHDQTFESVFRFHMVLFEGALHPSPPCSGLATDASDPGIFHLLWPSVPSAPPREPEPPVPPRPFTSPAPSSPPPFPFLGWAALGIGGALVLASVRRARTISRQVDMLGYQVSQLETNYRQLLEAVRQSQRSAVVDGGLRVPSSEVAGGGARVGSSAAAGNALAIITPTPASQTAQIPAKASQQPNGELDGCAVDGGEISSAESSRPEPRVEIAPLPVKPSSSPAGSLDVPSALPSSTAHRTTPRTSAVGEANADALAHWRDAFERARQIKRPDDDSSRWSDHFARRAAGHPCEIVQFGADALDSTPTERGPKRQPSFADDWEEAYSKTSPAAPYSCAPALLVDIEDAPKTAVASASSSLEGGQTPASLPLEPSGTTSPLANEAALSSPLGMDSPVAPPASKAPKSSVSPCLSASPESSFVSPATSQVGGIVSPTHEEVLSVFRDEYSLVHPGKADEHAFQTWLKATGRVHSVVTGSTEADLIEDSPRTVSADGEVSEEVRKMSEAKGCLAMSDPSIGAVAVDDAPTAMAEHESLAAALLADQGPSPLASRSINVKNPHPARSLRSQSQSPPERLLARCSDYFHKCRSPESSSFVTSASSGGRTSNQPSTPSVEPSPRPSSPPSTAIPMTYLRGRFPSPDHSFVVDDLLRSSIADRSARSRRPKSRGSFAELGWAAWFPRPWL